MPRSLSDVHYGVYTTHPDTLSVPLQPDPPLPEIIEPADQDDVPRPAAGDLEPLERVEHRKIKVLSTYWHEGWAAAQPGALLRAGTAARLYTVADSLPARFGLAVFDAWRPLALQQEIYDAAYTDDRLPAGFVSVPDSNPATPPPHLTGGTVDVTLTFDGVALELGSDFDAFVDDAVTDAFEQIPGRVRGLRRMLYWAMRDQGFVVDQLEWWHFEYGTRRWAAITGADALYGPAAPDRQS